MKSPLWTLLKNGTKVNVLGYEGVISWFEVLWPSLTDFYIFKEKLDTDLVVQRMNGKDHWVLVRITG